MAVCERNNPVNFTVYRLRVRTCHNIGVHVDADAYLGADCLCFGNESSLVCFHVADHKTGAGGHQIVKNPVSIPAHDARNRVFNAIGCNCQNTLQRRQLDFAELPWRKQRWRGCGFKKGDIQTRGYDCAAKVCLIFSQAH